MNPVATNAHLPFAISCVAPEALARVSIVEESDVPVGVVAVVALA